ncbi:uncharacterized protein [Emydura macquarii macquarii]|uniref:uncharacterized protein n=1 Tax=Emydura macquarii macquarii TaxID=1129001 RepID=UPI00352AA7D2
MDFRFCICLCLLRFMPSRCLPAPPEKNVTAYEGQSASIPLNTAEKTVDLYRRADSTHTQDFSCLLSVGSKPLCKGLRGRASVTTGVLLLHNVRKADEGSYEIRPHLNGNRTPTIIVHLEVKGCLPSSTQEPHEYLQSGTAHLRDRSSGQPGAMDNVNPLEWVIGLAVGVAMLIGLVISVPLYLLYQHLHRRRRQSSAHLASNPSAPQDSSCQLNGCQVDQALQEPCLLGQGLPEDQEHEVSV